MAIYGYHRTSTTEQHLDRGITAIQDYCNKNDLNLIDIFTDQQTGKNFNRPDYQFMKKRLCQGDVLIISEIDRLGRNKEDTLKELRFYKDEGIRVMILEIPTTLLDTSVLNSKDNMANMMMETINNMLIEMYAVFAQAETEKRSKRQAEGIEAMKQRGEFHKYGRPAKMTSNDFAKEYAKVLSGEEKPFECMYRLGLTKPTFYRYKRQYEKQQAKEPRTK